MQQQMLPHTSIHTHLHMLLFDITCVLKTGTLYTNDGLHVTRSCCCFSAGCCCEDRGREHRQPPGAVCRLDPPHHQRHPRHLLHHATHLQRDSASPRGLNQDRPIQVPEQHTRRHSIQVSPVPI